MNEGDQGFDYVRQEQLRNYNWPHQSRGGGSYNNHTTIPPDQSGDYSWILVVCMVIAGVVAVLGFAAYVLILIGVSVDFVAQWQPYLAGRDVVRGFMSEDSVVTRSWLLVASILVLLCASCFEAKIVKLFFGVKDEGRRLWALFALGTPMLGFVLAGLPWFDKSMAIWMLSLVGGLVLIGFICNSAFKAQWKWHMVGIGLFYLVQLFFLAKGIVDEAYLMAAL